MFLSEGPTSLSPYDRPWHRRSHSGQAGSLLCKLELVAWKLFGRESIDVAISTICGRGYGVGGHELTVEYDLATGTCVRRVVPLTSSSSASWEGESDDRSIF